MKLNLKNFYQEIEKKPGLMLRVSFSVFIVFFFFGFLAGNNYCNLQKRNLLSLKEAQKREETKRIEKIFVAFPEKKFLQMIKP